MYEEDRQTALAMYNQLFDEVDDEQGLLQLLVSPTRQAVVIARSYNAKERKLQVHAQSREESETADYGTAPEFIGVIDGILEEALSRQAPKTAEVSADQFSMFEDDFFAPTPEAPSAEAEAEVQPEAPAAEAAVEAPAEASPAEAAETEAEAAEAEAPDPAAPVDEVDAFIADFSIPADQQEFAPEAVEQTAPAEAAEPAAEAAEAAETEAEAAEAEAPDPAAPVDEVDAFIADFSIPADQQEFAPEAVEQTAPAEAAEPAAEAAEAAESAEGDSAPIEIEEEDVEEYDDGYYDEDYEPVRKPRVFLLILYILLAVPVGLLGILLLIVPTLLFLVLAGLIIAGGVMAVTSAFGSGIAVFADIMVIIGMAFILLALGLLALWIAVWLVGGAMVGLVRGLIHLGGKWCYKEVEA